MTYQKQLETRVPVAGLEYLDTKTHLEERLMLELRTSVGVPLAVIEQLGIGPEKFTEFVTSNQLQISGGQVQVTDSGRLFVDRIVLDLLT